MPKKVASKPRGMRFHRKPYTKHKFMGKGPVNGLTQNRKVTSLLART